MPRMFRDIAAVTRREFLYIWRDSRLRSVTIVAPFLYASLFCAIYWNHTLYDIPVALMNGDQSQPSRTLRRMLENSSKLRITHDASSVHEVEELLLSGDVDAAVVIPSNFSERLKRTEDVLVTAYVNAASMVSANMAAKAINEVVQTFSAGVEIKMLMKKGERLEAAKQHFMPVKLDLRSLYNPSFNYSNFMVPGILIAILQQVILLGVALSWTGEKEANSMKELFTMSSSNAAIIIGKMIPYFLINLVVAEFFLRVLFPLNDIPMEGSWLVAIPFTILFIVTIISWGMWVSALCPSRLLATQLLMFVAMPSFVLSGFTWPLKAMPGFVQVLSYALPMTYFVNSFRNIYLSGAAFRFVWLDFVILFAFASANVALIAWLVQGLRGRTTNDEA